MRTKKFMGSIVSGSGGLFIPKRYTTPKQAAAAVKRAARKHLAKASLTSKRKQTLRVRDVYSRKKDNVVLSKSGTMSEILQLK